MEFSHKNNLVEFVSDAFRNCTISRLVLGRRHEDLLDVIELVGKTVVIAGTLDLFVGLFDNGQDLLEFIDGFRRVKVWVTAWAPC